ncbi:RraA family protein [uncultured Friedmanniella sp.]|uniref:RraA family protein n=1 Tax=uncultured Friedmanniella sp. TaxID=335381 RepID=UPI0035CA0106
MPSETDLLDRLGRIDTTSLVDADKPSGGLRVLPPTLRPVRPGLTMTGPAFTVEARGDLLGMLLALREARPGDVLVVAAGGDEHAVAGELFATEAVRRQLAGILIDGRCRDSRTLARLELPVFAHGVAPSAFPASAVPVLQVPVMIGDVEVRPGDLVFGDDDGIVVGTVDATAAVIGAAEDIHQREQTLRFQIEAGESLLDHVNLDEHLAALRAGQPSSLAFS